MTGTGIRPRAALTVDVEDFFHATVFEGQIPRGQWESMPGRVADNTRRVLDFLSETGCKATFFVLGWVAEREPGLVREIRGGGHEIGSHGYEHRMVTMQSPEEFAKDVRKSKDILEGITGERIAGYRAPTFSITAKTPWAHRVLAEAGHSYSSSVFPIRHDRYGWPEFPRQPTEIRTESGRTIWELPLPTVSLPGLRLPYGGGGYLRIYPLWLTRLFFAAGNGGGMLPIVYFHPWEIDPEQPVLPRGRLSRIRHSCCQAKVLSRLGRLMKERDFGPVRRFLYNGIH